MHDKATSLGNTSGAARRYAVPAVALLTLFLAALAARLVGMDQLVARVQALGPWGPAALALVYVPATVLMIPGTLLTLAAGFLFGIVPGVIAVSIGSTVGSAAVFGLGRLLGRPFVEKLVSRRPGAGRLDRATERRGFLLVLLVRLSPAFPFNVVNYAFSVTSVRFRDYLLGSWLGMLPGTTLYVYFGSTLQDLSEAVGGNVAGNLPARIAGLVVALLFAVATAWVAKRELARDLPLGEYATLENS